jgi:acid phosphatase
MVVIAALVVLAGYTDAESPPPRADGGHAFPHPPKVAVLVLENRSYEQIIGSPDAPYINRLARRYTLATHYYGLTHPSLPNYIGLTSGSLHGVRSNCECSVSAPNLLGQLAAAGHTWRAYFEKLGSNREPGPITAEYNPHYNPFVYFETLRGRTRHRRRIVDFERLSRDLRRHRLADFSWIAPGVLHDGHDGTLLDADRYAAQLVPRVLRALGPGGVLYLTWDEGAHEDVRGASGPGGGRIPLIAAGDGAPRRTRVSLRANHYSLLRTIEAGFGLRTLGKAGSKSTPLLRGLLSGGPLKLRQARPGR